jgi:hypothetical protein
VTAECLFTIIGSGPESAEKRRNEMSTILIVILVLLLVGALPTWPHSANWGYYPTGGVGLILLILIILVLTGRL